MDETAAVRAALQAFQQGYTARQVRDLDSFLDLFCPDDEIEIIGTGAVTPQAGGEWCRGRAAIRTLIQNDWLYWGQLQLDVDTARIHVAGPTAWLSASGTVTDQIPASETYRDFSRFLEWIRQKEGLNDHQRLLMVARESITALTEAGRGETYCWPLRFTAVLQQMGSRWLFHQMQFAFPTTTYPGLRLEPPGSAAPKE